MDGRKSLAMQTTLMASAVVAQTNFPFSGSLKKECQEFN